MDGLDGLPGDAGAGIGAALRRIVAAFQNTKRHLLLAALGDREVARLAAA